MQFIFISWVLLRSQKLRVSKHEGDARSLLLQPHVGDIASWNKEEHEEKRSPSPKQLGPRRSNDYTDGEHGSFEDTRLPPLERKILEYVHLRLLYQLFLPTLQQHLRFLVSLCVTRSSLRVGEFWTLVSIQSGGILGYQNQRPHKGVQSWQTPSFSYRQS